MTNSSSRSVQRQELALLQKGLCYWCGVPMTPTLPPRKRGDSLYPDTMCTLDHVVDKLDPRRRLPPRKNETRRVAACWGCNQDRSVTAQIKAGIRQPRERLLRSRVSEPL